jgi:hypothetical protein
MSEYAPGLNLFIPSLVMMIVCLYYQIYQKSLIRNNRNFKFVFYTGFILVSIISIWGTVFWIMSLFQS